MACAAWDFNSNKHFGGFWVLSQPRLYFNINHECRLYWYQCNYEFCSSVRLFINSIIDPWSTFFVEKLGLCKFWASKQNNSKTVCNTRVPWVGQVYNIQPHKTILSSINERKREAWRYSNKLESFPTHHTSYHISWCYIDFLL